MKFNDTSIVFFRKSKKKGQTDEVRKVYSLDTRSSTAINLENLNNSKEA